MYTKKVSLLLADVRHVICGEERVPVHGIPCALVYARRGALALCIISFHAIVLGLVVMVLPATGFLYTKPGEPSHAAVLGESWVNITIASRVEAVAGSAD